MKPITFLETGKNVNWCHADCRYTSEEGELWLWDIDDGSTKIFKRG